MQVPRRFAGDFDLVVAHYECPPDEIALMKECARADLESAMRCFAVIAQEIKTEQSNREAQRA